MDINDVCSVIHLYKHPAIVIGKSKAIFIIGCYMDDISRLYLTPIRELIEQRIQDCPHVIIDLSQCDQYTRVTCTRLFSGLSTSTNMTLDQLKQKIEFKHDTNPTIQQIVANYLS